MNRMMSIALCVSAMAFGLASAPASADTFSTTAGPIPLTPVPLNVCVGDVCAKTPTLGNVRLTVEVTSHELLGLVPRIRPVACPPGQIGAALQVAASAQATTIGGSVSGNIGSLLFKRPIQEFNLPPHRTIMISACTF